MFHTVGALMSPDAVAFGVSYYSKFHIGWGDSFWCYFPALFHCCCSQLTGATYLSFESNFLPYGSPFGKMMNWLLLLLEMVSSAAL